MKAIILAAGRGSRMGEGTANLPKCMMTLGGKTLISRCVETLEAAEISRENIGIVTGYKSESIKQHISGVHYFHNAEWETTNMFVSLTKAREWLLNEPCIVCYSDIIFHKNAITMLKNSQASIAITYYSKFWELWEKRFENPLDDLETFKVAGKKLLEIGQRPHSKDEVEGQYMGLLRFEPQGWQIAEDAVKKPMPKPIERLDMTALLSHLLNLGIEIEAIKTDDPWFECDSLSDVHIATSFHGSGT
ncbi:MAG: phosphocholine cytidylyltransferase family protein [Fibromonadaceae bacterium]|jgi:choline kinase|nr:phosphocholine cytidylyltransferase family protein [Fibromonadaceae bacterium]